MSVSVFYRLMMDVKDVGEKMEYEFRCNAISADWKRFFYGLRMHENSWRLQIGSLRWKSQSVFLH